MPIETKIFDQKRIDETYEGYLTRNGEYYDDYKAVEQFILGEGKKHGIDISYDCSADEPMYFKTVNYTEYGKGLMLHSLSLEQTYRQYYSLHDIPETIQGEVDAVSYFSAPYTSAHNKYIDCLGSTRDYSGDSLIILPGDNLLKDTICRHKIKDILAVSEAYIKPHPLTSFRTVGELKDMFGDDKVVHKDENMFAMLPNFSKVYTAGDSDILLFAVAQGKEIGNIRAYSTSRYSAKSYISAYFVDRPIEENKRRLNYLFTDKLFGVVHPILHSNVSDRVANYFSAVMHERLRYKDFYKNKKEIKENR